MGHLLNVKGIRMREKLGESLGTAVMETGGDSQLLLHLGVITVR